MSFVAIAKRLKALADADTGSGGWFETGGANAINGVYALEAPQQSTSNIASKYPYIVLSPVSIVESDTFGSHMVDALIQVGVWADRTLGPAAADGITSRVRTVFHRVTPSAAIGDGWTPSACYLEAEATPEIDEDALHYPFELRLYMERSA